MYFIKLIVLSFLYKNLKKSKFPNKNKVTGINEKYNEKLLQIKNSKIKKNNKIGCNEKKPVALVLDKPSNSTCLFNFE